MIYVFIANGFEETEAISTIDVLRRAELEVVTVGIGSKEITSTHGIKVITDIADKDVTTDGSNEIEGIVLPGGMPGTLNLEKSPIVQACIRYCFENDLYVWAICAAPSILGHAGYLKGRKATCFPGYEQELVGAEVINESVVTDGKIVTAKGPGVTIDFALEIVRILKGPSLMENIRKSMQCRQKI